MQSNNSKHPPHVLFLKTTQSKVFLELSSCCLFWGFWDGWSIQKGFKMRHSTCSRNVLEGVGAMLWNVVKTWLRVEFVELNSRYWWVSFGAAENGGTRGAVGCMVLTEMFTEGINCGWGVIFIGFNTINAILCAERAASALLDLLASCMSDYLQPWIDATGSWFPPYLRGELFLWLVMFYCDWSETGVVMLHTGFVWLKLGRGWLHR